MAIDFDRLKDRMKVEALCGQHPTDSYYAGVGFGVEFTCAVLKRVLNTLDLNDTDLDDTDFWLEVREEAFEWKKDKRAFVAQLKEDKGGD